jgi:hypothetical protein
MKNNNNSNIEAIPAAALSEATTSGALAVIINTTGDGSVLKALNTLFCHSTYKIFYIEPGINQLKKCLELCHSLKIKAIVLSGEELPAIKTFAPELSYSASLISSGSEVSENSILDYILEDKLASEFSHIGFQAYKYDSSKLTKLRERFFEDLRLGNIRTNMQNTEPLLRGNTHIFFDLRSIRVSDFPENSTQAPNGLYAEEACQLARYIGMGQKLQTIFIYGFPSKCKYKSTSMQLTAEILWHLSEALASNISEDPGTNGTSDLFNRKTVSMGQEGQDLTFITSNTTGRWWMEIPEAKSNKNQFIPCSYSDYLTAYSGEIPLRWLFFYQKINPI